MEPRPSMGTRAMHGGYLIDGAAPILNFFALRCISPIGRPTPHSNMVSFNCDCCGDVITKGKIKVTHS